MRLAAGPKPLVGAVLSGLAAAEAEKKRITFACLTLSLFLLLLFFS